MPDISGFTEFVKQTEIKHSKHIIKELLEILLDQNEADFELAEIEGDALFLYRTDGDIAPRKLIDQIRSMYLAFHQHLLHYKYRRICNCGACTNADGLQLKFIVHEAEIEFIEIRGTKKPFGEEVIKVHRLLKNTIPENEYVLFTSEYLATREDSVSNEFPDSIKHLEQTFDFGPYNYGYVNLDHLIQESSIDDPQARPILGRQLLSKEIEIAADPKDVFQFIVDFEKRHLWSPGVDRVDYDPKAINQIGSEHICVIGGNKIAFSSVFSNVDGDDMVFIETSKNAPVIKDLSGVYSVIPTADGARVVAKLYTKSTSLLSKLMTPLLRYKIGAGTEKALQLMKGFVEEGK